MKSREIPREGLVRSLRERACAGSPLLVAGPMGAGKTTLLRVLEEVLQAAGCHVVVLDLMGAVSSPDRFVSAALRALPPLARDLPRAEEIQRLTAAGRSQEAAAVDGLLEFWGTLDEIDGRPLALLLDEVTEIRSLAYFGGLRQVDRSLGSALAHRRSPTVLTTSFPTQARRLWPFDVFEVPPLTAPELKPVLETLDVVADVESFTRASFGWPRYVRVLLDRLATGSDLAAAWTEEMALGGRLECACRHTYETLLLRSRGYGMSKAVLAAVAEEEGLNLSALVSRFRRTPGAVRDYLQWLVSVDALRMAGKRYLYVDGLLRVWVRLHARGIPATATDIRTAAADAGIPATG